MATRVDMFKYSRREIKTHIQFFFFFVGKVRKVEADMESTEDQVFTHKQQDTVTQENTIDSTESMGKLH